MNIETWAYVRHLFFVEKLPKKAIARELNLDIKTVRRAINRDAFSYGGQKSRSSKLDRFKDKIEALLKSYPSLSAVRIYEEIQKIGYEGGISILSPTSWFFIGFGAKCGYFWMVAIVISIGYVK